MVVAAASGIGSGCTHFLKIQLSFHPIFYKRDRQKNKKTHFLFTFLFVTFYVQYDIEHGLKLNILFMKNVDILH